MYESADLPDLDLKKFALKSGYVYDGQKGTYSCTNGKVPTDASFLMVNQSESKSRYIVLSFFKTSTFLNYKSLLDNNGEPFSSHTNDNVFTEIYLYKDKFISLSTETTEDAFIYTLTVIR